jgi:hypothetical protein
MWPIQLAFRFLIACRIFLYSLTLSNSSPIIYTHPVYLLATSDSHSTLIIIIIIIQQSVWRQV